MRKMKEMTRTTNNKPVKVGRTEEEESRRENLAEITLEVATPGFYERKCKSESESWGRRRTIIIVIFKDKPVVELRSRKRPGGKCLVQYFSSQTSLPL